MNAPKALVLRTAGTNCERESAHALTRAGAQVDVVHLGRFLESPEKLRAYRIVVFPGGFSYGDDIASGVVYGVEMRNRVTPELRRMIADGALVLGICNGFQILVRAGLLPATTVGSRAATGQLANDPALIQDLVAEGTLTREEASKVAGRNVVLQTVGAEFRSASSQEATLAPNLSGRYECRWIRLEVTTDRCAFLRKGETFDCPVAHAEGRFVVKDDAVRERMRAAGQFALRYVAEGGGAAEYPWNPSGTPDGVAGVCDPTGRVLGLMPHPERNVESWHHPDWTLGTTPAEGAGLSVFRNAVRAAR